MVIHHLPDLSATALELLRVVRPGDAVLMRSAFAGRHQAIRLFRFLPEAIRVLDTYPSVADVEAAFATCEFITTAFEQVPQDRTFAAGSCSQHAQGGLWEDLKLDNCHLNASAGVDGT